MITFLVMYWRQIAGVLVIGALLGAVYGFGYHSASNHYERVIAEQELQTAMEHADAIARAQEADAALGEQALLQAKLAAQQERAEQAVPVTVIKWKVQYAKDPNAGKCLLLPDFVRAHTAAITGRLPEATAAGTANAGPGRADTVAR